MEIALNISRIEFLKWLDPEYHTETAFDEATAIRITESRLYGAWVERLRAMFGEVSIGRVYLGSEFCERLMPADEKILEVISVCEPRNIDVTMVTPFVTHVGIDRVKRWIPLLKEYAKRKQSKCEIVVNDLGTLQLLQEHREWFAPVIGRCLHKIKRDPCAERVIQDMHDKGPCSDAAGASGFLRTIRCSALTSMPYRTLLHRMGCDRVELDPLAQGYEMNLERLGFRASLHLPYQYITAGRYCLAGSLELLPHEKFTIDRPCKRECDRIVTRMEHGQVDRPVYRRGNAVYGAFNVSDIKSAIEDAGISRVVLAPGIPA